MYMVHVHVTFSAPVWSLNIRTVSTNIIILVFPDPMAHIHYSNCFMHKHNICS